VVAIQGVDPQVRSFAINAGQAGQFTPPSDGWIQVLTSGEWPNKDAGLVQVVDDQAVQNIVETFNRERTEAGAAWPGLLVDFDHFSHDRNHPSEAAAWVDDLQVRGKDVWAHFRFTESGNRKVTGGEYRLVSPVLTDFSPTGTEKTPEGLPLMRPNRLSRIALTNAPNITGMVPVSNRGAAAAPAEVKRMDHKSELCKLLGVPADAGDDKIQEAIEAVNRDVNELQAAVDEDPAPKDSPELVEAKNRIAELERALVEQEAKRFEGLVPDTDEARGELRTLLASNREAAVAVLANIQPPKPANTIPAVVFNRNYKPVPATVDETAEDGKFARCRVRANEIVAMNRKSGINVTYQSAFQQAVAEMSGVDPNISRKAPLAGVKE
jgi:phage I-like protein